MNVWESALRLFEESEITKRKCMGVIQKWVQANDIDMNPQETQDLAGIAADLFDVYVRNKNVQKLLQYLGGAVLHFFDEHDDFRVSHDQEKDLLRQLGAAFGARFPE